MERTASLAVRPLYITPHGTSINAVIRLIMDDLHNNAVNGVGPDGRAIRTFIDTVSLLGDFPHATAFTDVLGHTAIELCTMCTMRRRKGTNYPEKNYYLKIHSRRLGYTRFNDRRLAIRAGNPAPKILRAVDIKYLTSVSPEQLSAVYFSKIYTETPSARKIAEN